MHGPPFEGILIDGVAKLDLHAAAAGGGAAAADAAVARWTCPEGWWVVSEPTLVPKTPAAGGDDDERGAAADDVAAAGAGDEVYVLVFVSAVAPADGRDALGDAAERGDGRASRLVVIDAARMEAVATLALPGAAPYGLHSAFVPWADLAPARPGDDDDDDDDGGAGAGGRGGAALDADAARAAFDAFDFDRRGRLARAELTHAARATGVPLTEGEVAALVDAVEAGADGRADVEAWCRALRGARMLVGK